MKTAINLLAVSGLAALLVAGFRFEPAESPAAETVAASKSIPELPRRTVPPESEREGLRARLVLREHGRQNGAGMYSLGLELENASFSTMARVEFDLSDLSLELLDSKGQAMAPSPRNASAPVQLAYQVVIPGNCSLLLPVHDHGYGFANAIWGNDHTVWETPPGEYQIRGTVTVSVSYGRPQLTGPNGNRLEAPSNWEGKPERVELKIPLSKFTLPAVE